MKKLTCKFIKKASKFLAIFVLAFAWIFSGWPPVWNFPPEIQEARADTDTYYGTYDDANTSMTDKAYAETDDSQYAYGGKNTTAVIQSWSGTAGSGVISGVRIYCQHYATTPDEDDFTLVDYSLDNWVSTGTTTGQQVMPGSESSFSVDIFADRAWDWTDIGNLEVRAAAKASGKQNFTDDYIDVLYIQVDYTAVSVSVSVENGVVTYGPVTVNSTHDTTTSGTNNSQTATNDGNVEENFNIMGQDSGAWELADTAAGETYTHKFCITNCDSSPSWTAFNEDGYTPLATDIAALGSQVFDIQVGTPVTTSNYTVQNIDIIIQAVDST